MAAAVDHEARRQEISEALGSIGRIRIIAELARKPNNSFSKHALEAATGIKVRTSRAVWNG